MLVRRIKIQIAKRWVKDQFTLNKFIIINDNKFKENSSIGLGRCGPINPACQWSLAKSHRNSKKLSISIKN